MTRTACTNDRPFRGEQRCVLANGHHGSCWLVKRDRIPWLPHVDALNERR